MTRIFHNYEILGQNQLNMYIVSRSVTISLLSSISLPCYLIFSTYDIHPFVRLFKPLSLSLDLFIT